MSMRTLDHNGDHLLSSMRGGLSTERRRRRYYRRMRRQANAAAATTAAAPRQAPAQIPPRHPPAASAAASTLRDLRTQLLHCRAVVPVAGSPSAPPPPTRRTRGIVRRKASVVMTPVFEYTVVYQTYLFNGRGWSERPISTLPPTRFKTVKPSQTQDRGEEVYIVDNLSDTQVHSPPADVQQCLRLIPMTVQPPVAAAVRAST